LLRKIHEAFDNGVGVDDVRVKVVGHPFLAFSMALVPRISGGFVGFGISWRTAEIRECTAPVTSRRRG
jgi:hypothetical protein